MAKSGGGLVQPIRGDEPLKHGSVHKWRVSYQGGNQGGNQGLVIGVIAGKKFYSSRISSFDVYGCFNGGIPLNTSGTCTKWEEGDVIEITVDLVNYTINLKEVGSGYIDFNGELPRLDGDSYYPYCSLLYPDQKLYIVE
ncbi:hypothetical protein P9112_009898 [Eukaryota sp. TZLM1-RC]